MKIETPDVQTLPPATNGQVAIATESKSADRPPFSDVGQPKLAKAQITSPIEQTSEDRRDIQAPFVVIDAGPVGGRRSSMPLPQLLPPPQNMSTVIDPTLLSHKELGKDPLKQEADVPHALTVPGKTPYSPIAVPTSSSNAGPSQRHHSRRSARSVYVEPPQPIASSSSSSTRKHKRQGTMALFPIEILSSDEDEEHPFIKAISRSPT